MQGKFLEWNENNCLVPQDVSKETVAIKISYVKVWTRGGTEIWYVLSYPVLIREFSGTYRISWYRVFESGIGSIPSCADC